MTRSALALASLWLLACSPPDSGEGSGGSTSVPVGAVRVSGQTSRARQERAARSSAQKPAPREEAGFGSGGYQYVDETGRVRLAARLEDVPERQRSTASHISVAPSFASRRTTQAPEAEDRPTTSAPVVVYTTRTCPYCRAAIAYMEKIGQDYENKDVEADEDARDEYLQITGGERGVPVIVVGQAWMQGWDQRRFDKLIAQSR